MTSALKMLVQKGIIIFGLSDSTIVLTKSFLQSSTSLFRVSGDNLTDRNQNEIH